MGDASIRRFADDLRGFMAAHRFGEKVALDGDLRAIAGERTDFAFSFDWHKPGYGMAVAHDGECGHSGFNLGQYSGEIGLGFVDVDCW